jgi:hypothetical protein
VNSVKARLAAWEAIEKARHERRLFMQQKRRDKRRADGLTTLGKPYQKLKWQFKLLPRKEK